MIRSKTQGAIMSIGSKDVKRKGQAPKLICNQVSRKTNAKFAMSWMADQSGWIVERLPADKAGVG